jgi:phenylacetate-coenzyme A ligase PaaK-like adenylate-forming protein
MSYHRKRIVDVARALRTARELGERERWPRERLEAHQREQLDALVRHARDHAPYYRDRVPAGPVELSALPTLDKATMMEHFDELVADRRLHRDALLDHLDGLEHDALYLGQYRVMTTSGSSGRKGLFVYDRPGFVGCLALFLRCNAFIGVDPRIPRLKIAAIGGGSPTHMSRRGAATLSIGLHRILSLPVTLPIARLVEALNAFQPDYVNAFPSMAALLADEQLAGRLRIAPQRMTTSSELRTPEVTERMVAAFGVRPFDIYATTEGIWGCSCEHDNGIHLFEDMAPVENVDAEGRPVPEGEPGARLLVTNLFNRVQPLLRCEVSDLVTIDSAPCPCGRTLRRMRSIDGRADDVLVLGDVAVHPLQFGVVTADRDVREFQVVQRGDRLRLRVALREDAAVAEATHRLRERVAERLADAGVRDTVIEVETCAGIERPPHGKLQMIVADRSLAPPSGNTPVPARR